MQQQSRRLLTPEELNDIEREGSRRGLGKVEMNDLKDTQRRLQSLAQFGDPENNGRFNQSKLGPGKKFNAPEKPSPHSNDYQLQSGFGRIAKNNAPNKGSGNDYSRQGGYKQKNDSQGYKSQQPGFGRIAKNNAPNKMSGNDYSGQGGYMQQNDSQGYNSQQPGFGRIAKNNAPSQMSGNDYSGQGGYMQQNDSQGYNSQQPGFGRIAKNNAPNQMSGNDFSQQGGYKQQNHSQGYNSQQQGFGRIAKNNAPNQMSGNDFSQQGGYKQQNHSQGYNSQQPRFGRMAKNNAPNQMSGNDFLGQGSGYMQQNDSQGYSSQQAGARQNNSQTQEIPSLMQHYEPAMRTETTVKTEVMKHDIYFCHICQCPVPGGPNSIQMHNGGKSHQRKMQVQGQQGILPPEVTSTVSAPPQLVPQALCELCNIKVRIDCLETHIPGEHHKKNLAKYEYLDKELFKFTMALITHLGSGFFNCDVCNIMIARVNNGVSLHFESAQHQAQDKLGNSHLRQVFQQAATRLDNTCPICEGYSTHMPDGLYFRHFFTTEHIRNCFTRQNDIYQYGHVPGPHWPELHAEMVMILEKGNSFDVSLDLESDIPLIFKTEEEKKMAIFRKLHSGVIDCEICEIGVTSSILAMRGHIEGQQHKTKAMMRIDPIKNLIYISGKDCKWQCELCDIEATSGAWEKHIYGRRHVQACFKNQSLLKSRFSSLPGPHWPQLESKMNELYEKLLKDEAHLAALTKQQSTTPPQQGISSFLQDKYHNSQLVTVQDQYGQLQKITMAQLAALQAKKQQSLPLEPQLQRSESPASSDSGRQQIDSGRQQIERAQRFEPQLRADGPPEFPYERQREQSEPRSVQSYESRSQKSESPPAFPDESLRELPMQHNEPISIQSDEFQSQRSESPPEFPDESQDLQPVQQTEPQSIQSSEHQSQRTESPPEFPDESKMEQPIQQTEPQSIQGSERQSQITERLPEFPDKNQKERTVQHTEPQSIQSSEAQSQRTESPAEFPDENQRERPMQHTEPQPVQSRNVLKNLPRIELPDYDPDAQYSSLNPPHSETQPQLQDQLESIRKAMTSEVDDSFQPHASTSASPPLRFLPLAKTVLNLLTKHVENQDVPDRVEGRGRSREDRRQPTNRNQRERVRDDNVNRDKDMDRRNNGSRSDRRPDINRRDPDNRQSNRNERPNKQMDRRNPRSERNLDQGRFKEIERDGERERDMERRRQRESEDRHFRGREHENVVGMPDRHSHPRDRSPVRSRGHPYQDKPQDFRLPPYDAIVSFIDVLKGFLRIIQGQTPWVILDEVQALESLTLAEQNQALQIQGKMGLPNCLPAINAVLGLRVLDPRVMVTLDSLSIQQLDKVVCNFPELVQDPISDRVLTVLREVGIQDGIMGFLGI